MLLLKSPTRFRRRLNIFVKRNNLFVCFSSVLEVWFVCLLGRTDFNVVERKKNNVEIKKGIPIVECRLG